MAKWAFLAAIAACFSVGVTAVGIWFVKQTLDATRAAVGEAEKGTKAAIDAAKASADGVAAARETNEITRYAYTIDQRPWLRWKILHISIRRSGKHLRVDIGAQIENFGRTPALELIYFGRCYTTQPGEALVNVGLRFHAEHLRSYQEQRQPALTSVLPGEIMPILFGPSIDLEKLNVDSDGKFSLFLSFHAAYRFFDRATIGEIGAVYFIHRPRELLDKFSLSDFDGAGPNIFVTEAPGGRRIT